MRKREGPRVARQRPIAQHRTDTKKKKHEKEHQPSVAPVHGAACRRVLSPQRDGKTEEEEGPEDSEKEFVAGFEREGLHGLPEGLWERHNFCDDRPGKCERGQPEA